jgi:hypothetical protein
MLVLRILVALLVITLGLSLVVFAINKDRRWLRFAWQALKLGLIIVLIFIALLALERFLVMI